MLHQCGLSVESLTCRIFCSLRPVQACRVVETVGAGQHGACVYVHLGWCFFNLLACLYLCVRVVFPVASTTGSVVLESSLRTRPWSGCSDSSSLLKENLVTCAIFLKKWASAFIGVVIRSSAALIFLCFHHARENWVWLAKSCYAHCRTASSSECCVFSKRKAKHFRCVGMYLSARGLVSLASCLHPGVSNFCCSRAQHR